MNTRRASKNGRVISIATGVVLIAVLMVWHFRVAPRLLWNVTYQLHIMPLEESVIRFSTEYKRLPTSVEEMLKAGALPQRSKLYYCPIKHNSFFSKELDISETEIELVFRADEVVVKVPDALYAQKRQSPRFRWLLDGSLKRRIPRGATFDPLPDAINGHHQ